VAGGVVTEAARVVAGRVEPASSGALRWVDGFVFSLTMPAALIATLGYSVGSLGTWAAVVLWGVSMLLAILANRAYAELAGMFPHKSGGIALYAWEGWRRYFTPVGPVATFGYWFAWSSSMAIYAGIIGSLVQTEWFTGQTWTWSLGVTDVTLPRLIAAGVLVLVWAANVLGLRPTLLLTYLTAGLLLVPLAVFMFLPYLTGDWSSASFTSNLSLGSGSSWKLVLVWLYIMCWTSLGVEVCATFTPEYRNRARDAARALRMAALFSLGVFVLLPLGAVGTAGQPAVMREPLTFYAPAFQEIVGGAAGLMIALMVGSLVLVIVTCMADSARALYGISEDGMTIRELDRLNRFGVPARAMTVDLVLNLCLVFFVGSTLAIVAAGNLGYITAHVFALSALVLLRRDRPDWPRPVRLSGAAVVVTAVLAMVLVVLLVVGATSFDLTGYGGTSELLIAFGILLLSVVLFAFRRVVQDRRRLRLREPSPETV
jgi:amino acid transporter